MTRHKLCQCLLSPPSCFFKYFYSSIPFLFFCCFPPKCRYPSSCSTCDCSVRPSTHRLSFFSSPLLGCFVSGFNYFRPDTCHQNPLLTKRALFPPKRRLSWAGRQCTHRPVPTTNTDFSNKRVSPTHSPLPNCVPPRPPPRTSHQVFSWLVPVHLSVFFFFFTRGWNKSNNQPSLKNFSCTQVLHHIPPYKLPAQKVMHLFLLWPFLE